MRRYRRIVLFAVIVLIGGGLVARLCHESTEEGRCRLRRRAIGDPSESRLIEFAWQILRPLSAEPDPSESKLSGHAWHILRRGLMQPNQATGFLRESNKLIAYQMAAGTENIQIAMDVSDTPKLLVDTDGNGLLSDEHDLTPKFIKLGGWEDQGGTKRRFGPICITSGEGDDQAIASFYALHQTPDRTRSLLLYPTHYQYGRLRLDEKVYAIAIVDGDYDGRFGSMVSPPVENIWRWAQADIFAIDYNRNGQFDLAPPGSPPEIMPLGKLMRLGDTYYAIDVARDGSHLALDAVTPPMGSLVFDPPNATMDVKLWSDTCCQSFRGVNNLDLPAGSYQAADEAVLNIQDAEGNDWRYLMAPGQFGTLKFFEIHPNKTTRIKIGPPFLVTADIICSQNRTVSIYPIVRGVAGEEYYKIWRNYRPSQPTLRIIAENGTILVDDGFEYG
jgi:hypothetical protein